MNFVVSDTGRRFPLAALMLGAGGLLPFIGGAAFVVLFPNLQIMGAFPLLIYGAIILSFLGGVRWGFAVLEPGASWKAYGLSVVPSLFGWAAALRGGPWGLFLLAAGLVVWFAAERFDPALVGVPNWYWRLRGALTAVAALSLLTAGLAVMR